MNCLNPRTAADCAFCPADCKDRLHRCDNPSRATDCEECYDPVRCRNRLVNPKWGTKEWLLLAGIILSFLIVVFLIAKRYLRRTGLLGYEKLRR